MNSIASKAIGSAGASVRALNPHLFGQLPLSSNPLVERAKPATRIKQGETKLRAWEKEWFDKIKATGRWNHVRAQSLRVRLANGAWYKPDVSGIGDFGQLWAWEVKGGAKMKGVAKGVLVLKVAASQYPEIRWTLVWKENRIWKQQEILP